jgi:ATP-dependent 26S proteasome regulatory subunit
MAASTPALTVHRRDAMDDDDLVLPAAIRASLDYHLLDFTASRKALIALGQSGRKGVLLYGPPGTGKTHTIRYLAQRLVGHTTFLVTAEQVGLIATYFRLARLFAPSMIVIEDADLIARQREQLNSACDEVMLNRLLNEMDGLRPDAEVLVVMTTNRPEALEHALLQRPGRIDHAIEIPVPDAACRERLFQLYGAALAVEEAQLSQLVARTDGVTASFIKELARRLAQRSIQAGHVGRVDAEDVDAVLGEMLGERDGLNLRLLGGAAG